MISENTNLFYGGTFSEPGDEEGEEDAQAKAEHSEYDHSDTHRQICIDVEDARLHAPLPIWGMLVLRACLTRGCHLLIAVCTCIGIACLGILKSWD